MLASDLLLIASVLRDGDCPPYAQQLACSQLQRIAESMARLEELADSIVGDAAVAERRKQLRIVQGKTG